MDAAPGLFKQIDALGKPLRRQLDRPPLTRDLCAETNLSASLQTTAAR